MLHAKAMAYGIAYDIYLEIAEGNLSPSWMLEKKEIVSFYCFREKLSKQMLEYDPRNRKYPRDEKFLIATKQPKMHRAVPKFTATATPRTSRLTASVTSSTTPGITEEDIKHAGVRLCGDLSKFKNHVESIIHLPAQNKRICVACGKATRWACGICGKAMHYPSIKD
jgi:hypothetical protein